MSKKLILLLLLLTLAIVIYLVRIPQKPTIISSPIPLSFSPTPTLSTESSLSFIPDTIYALAGQNNEANIQLNTQGEYPANVQLELAYDPAILTEITLTPGTLFPKSTVLLNNNYEATGRISYALSLDKNEKPQNFSGTTAIIKFKVRKNIIQNQTTIYFLPKTTIISQSGNIPLKITYELRIIINPSTQVASGSPSLK